MEITSNTAARARRHDEDESASAALSGAPLKTVPSAPREIDLDAVGNDAHHEASLAAFMGARAGGAVATGPHVGAATFTVGSMLPPWRQEVPVTSNGPADMDKVQHNMLDRPDADAVLFLGMNTDASLEERRALAARANVVTVTSNLNMDDQMITSGDRTFDLRPQFHNGVRVVDSATGEPSRSQFKDFLCAQGMTAPQAARIGAHMDALKSDAARVELAQIAAVMWKGQSGAVIPSRILISGHSGTGGAAWGNGSQDLGYDDIRFLAREMPRAAAQVEDIHIGTCSSLNNVTLDLHEWQADFPNLKTVWAYEHAAGSGAVRDQADWEKQTRGHADSFTVDETMTRDQVATWSAHGNTVTGVGAYGELALKLQTADRRYNQAMSGALRDPEALVNDYRAYRAVSQRQDFSSYQRASGAERAGQLLRLRYYPEVSARFAEAHASEITQGYSAAGLRAPDFARLDRTAARAQIQALVAKAGAAPENASLNRAAALLTRFDLLDPKLLPETWCQHQRQVSR